MYTICFKYKQIKTCRSLHFFHWVLTIIFFVILKIENFSRFNFFCMFFYNFAYWWGWSLSCVIKIIANNKMKVSIWCPYVNVSRNVPWWKLYEWQPKLKVVGRVKNILRVFRLETKIFSSFKITIWNLLDQLFKIFRLVKFSIIFV